VPAPGEHPDRPHSPIAFAELAGGAEILEAQGPSSTDSGGGPVAPGPASATPLLLAELNIKSGAVQPANGDLERLLARQPQALALAAAAPKPLPGQDEAKRALAGLR